MTTTQAGIARYQTEFEIFFRMVSFVVVSSAVDASDLEWLTTTFPDTLPKLRSFYWYTQCVETNQLDLAARLFGRSSPIEKDRVEHIVTLNLQHGQLDIATDHQQVKTSRSVFFLVLDTATADFVSPLSSNPLTRVLLKADAQSLRNWLHQMEQKESQLKQLLEEHISKELSTKGYSLPPPTGVYLVHILVVLPVLVELSDQTLQQFTLCIREQPYWSELYQNLLHLCLLQKQYMCGSSNSRLTVWVTTLDYILHCYDAKLLVNPPDVPHLMLQWNQTIQEFQHHRRCMPEKLSAMATTQCPSPESKVDKLSPKIPHEPTQKKA